MTPAIGRLEEGDKVSLSYTVGPIKEGDQGRENEREGGGRGEERRKSRRRGRMRKRNEKILTTQGLNMLFNRHKPCSESGHDLHQDRKGHK